jgi:hypothetical protein
MAFAQSAKRILGHGDKKRRKTFCSMEMHNMQNYWYDRPNFPNKNVSSI